MRLRLRRRCTGLAWQSAHWSPGDEFDLGDMGRLELRAATGEGLSRERLVGELTVVPRPSGAVFRPAGCAHQRELRKWLQERGVLPWQRALLPCVCAAGEIVAVGDLAYGGRLAAAPGEPSWRVVWHDRPTLDRGRGGRADVRVRTVRGLISGGRQGADPIDCPPVVLLLRRWLP